MLIIKLVSIALVGVAWTTVMTPLSMGFIVLAIAGLIYVDLKAIPDLEKKVR